MTSPKLDNLQSASHQINTVISFAAMQYVGYAMHTYQAYISACKCHSMAHIIPLDFHIHQHHMPCYYCQGLIYTWSHRLCVWVGEYVYHLQLIPCTSSAYSHVQCINSQHMASQVSEYLMATTKHALGSRLCTACYTRTLVHSISIYSQEIICQNVFL